MNDKTSCRSFLRDFAAQPFLVPTFNLPPPENTQLTDNEVTERFAPLNYSSFSPSLLSTLLQRRGRHRLTLEQWDTYHFEVFTCCSLKTLYYGVFNTYLLHINMLWWFRNTE